MRKIDRGRSIEIPVNPGVIAGVVLARRNCL
jgi:hypothetical protein